MIQLDVKEYCQACPHFEPEVVQRPKTTVFHQESFAYIPNIPEKFEVTNGNTIVICKNRGRCAAMYAFLKGESQHG